MGERGATVPGAVAAVPYGFKLHSASGVLTINDVRFLAFDDIAVPCND